VYDVFDLFDIPTESEIAPLLLCKYPVPHVVLRSVSYFSSLYCCPGNDQKWKVKQDPEFVKWAKKSKLRVAGKPSPVWLSMSWGRLTEADVTMVSSIIYDNREEVHQLTLLWITFSLLFNQTKPSLNFAAS
jgi:hypothetical protein